MTLNHRDMIERDAVHPTFKESLDFPTEHEIEFSKAISLRRIADASERLATALEYNPTTYNIIDAIKEARR